MAKSSRSTTRKANNRRLKSKVFGPVEDARAERLSAKLLELAAQPKPSATSDDGDMKVVDDAGDEAGKAPEEPAKETEATAVMDVDAAPDNTASSKSKSKHRVQKRKTSKIVFSKWGEKRSSKRRKH